MGAPTWQQGSGPDAARVEYKRYLGGTLALEEEYGCSQNHLLGNLY